MADRTILSVALASITVSHNPRNPTQALSDALEKEGYADKTVLDLVHELALSDDAAKRAEFCRLLETYEGEAVPDGIVNLAKSRANSEIQPILLRDFRSKDGDAYVTRYGVVAGERRTLAAAYNFAKHGLPAVIGAVVRKLTVAEAYDLAVEENAQRRPMTALEYGRIFAGYRNEINPATGKKWSLKEIAEKLHLDYQFVRGREALTHLPENEQRRLESGKANVTKAIAKGLSLKRGKKDDRPVEDKKEHRQRTLTVKQVQALVDVEAGRVIDDADLLEAARRGGYIAALAAVLQQDVATVLAESAARREEAEELAAAKAVEAQHDAKNAEAA